MSIRVWRPKTSLPQTNATKPKPPPQVKQKLSLPQSQPKPKAPPPPPSPALLARNRRRDEQHAIKERADRIYAAIQAGHAEDDICSMLPYDRKWVHRYIRKQAAKYAKWQKGLAMLEGGATQADLVATLRISPTKAARWDRERLTKLQSLVGSAHA